MVAPVSQVSSTISTRRPTTMRGGPAITTGRPPLSVRVMAIDAKSRCRMLATTAPGMTPARAIPITTSGSYSRKTLSASARHISPKNGQSTSRTPCGVFRTVPLALRGGGGRGGGGGGGGGAGMRAEATLQSHAAASYFRPMGFWRRLFGGSGADDIAPQRLDYLNEALALERQGDFEAALTSYRLALRDHPDDARILQNMAIAFTKTRRVDEAIRHYRRVLAAAATCKVSTDLSRDIAIEVRAPDSLEEYDTLKPTARVLTGHGDSSATAVFWFSPDSAIAVLDSTTGRTVVIHTGQTGRLV